MLTDGAGPTRATIVGFAIATAPRTAWFVPVGRTGGSLLDPVRTACRSTRVLPASSRCSNASAAEDRARPEDRSRRAARHGVTLAGLGLDTMIASYLIDPTRSAHTLEDTALEHLGYKALSEEDVAGKGAKATPLAHMPADALKDFAGERADLPLQLAPGLAERLESEQLTGVWETLERPLIPALVAIERAGIRVDVAACASSRPDSSASSRNGRAGSTSWPASSSTSDSPKQLGEVLFEKLQLPAPKRYGKTRAISTAAEVLEELAQSHEVPRLVLEWRGSRS